MTHHWLDDRVSRVVVDAIVPLTQETTHAIVHKMSHAVGHSLGPDQYRNDYMTDNREAWLDLAESLGLVRVHASSIPGGRCVARVTDAGKAVLRQVYAAVRRHQKRKPLKAFYVDSTDEDDNIDALRYVFHYGEMPGGFVLGESAGKVRAAVVRQRESDAPMREQLAETRVRRARELDAVVRECWQDSFPDDALVWIPARDLFAGPYENLTERRAQEARRHQKESAA